MKMRILSWALVWCPTFWELSTSISTRTSFTWWWQMEHTKKVRAVESTLVINIHCEDQRNVCVDLMSVKTQMVLQLLLLYSSSALASLHHVVKGLRKCKTHALLCLAVFLILCAFFLLFDCGQARNRCWRVERHEMFPSGSEQLSDISSHPASLLDNFLDFYLYHVVKGEMHLSDISSEVLSQDLSRMCCGCHTYNCDCFRLFFMQCSL